MYHFLATCTSHHQTSPNVFELLPPFPRRRPVWRHTKALKTAKARAECAQAYEREFKLSNAAAKYFKDHGITKLPGTKALQAEIQQLTSEQNARYKDYREKQRRVKELETVKSNLENMLGHKKEKRHELIPS